MAACPQGFIHTTLLQGLRYLVFHQYWNESSRLANVC